MDKQKAINFISQEIDRELAETIKHRDELLAQKKLLDSLMGKPNNTSHSNSKVNMRQLVRDILAQSDDYMLIRELTAKLAEEIGDKKKASQTVSSFIYGSPHEVKIKGKRNNRQVALR